MARDPLRRTSRRPDEPQRPRIWAEGGQRPPFVVKAFGQASLHLARVGVAPLNAWAARRTRQLAEKVRDGAGRIPAEKLGRAARFVPSHLRVAAWIKNAAAVLAHASATADPDVPRGNALVAEIEPHLWSDDPAPAPQADPAPPPEPATPPQEVAPVVLPEPAPPEADPRESDPLAAIRGELEGRPATARQRGAGTVPGPARLPDPPGSVATTAIQVTGYVIGWATTIIALPYGATRSLWLYAKGTDLRGIGQED
jgi:hypothetical protein